MYRAHVASRYLRNPVVVSAVQELQGVVASGDTHEVSAQSVHEEAVPPAFRELWNYVLQADLGQLK